VDLQDNLISNCPRIHFSLSDLYHRFGLSAFDTTFPILCCTFDLTISLVDPTIHFSKLRNDWSSVGVSCQPPIESKICFCIHFCLPFASLDHRGWCYSFGDELIGPSPEIFVQVRSYKAPGIVSECPIFLAVVALPEFGSCLP